MNTLKTEAEWHLKFFTGAALNVWRKAIPMEVTAEEVEFLHSALQLTEGASLLDVPCGNGRLSLPLAIAGFKVTGFDTSLESLEDGKRIAKEYKAQIEYVERDIRSINRTEEFDGAFCMGNSFGYFDGNETTKFFHSVAAALKPGARFVIESSMISESFLINGGEREWMRVGDHHMLVENTYNCRLSRVESTYTFLANGKEERRQAIHWIFSSGELCKMLEHSGFRIVDLLESTDFEPYSLGSERLLLIAEKA